MKLIKPQIEQKQAALAYRQAFADTGATSIDGACGFHAVETYEDWLANMEFINAGKHETYLPSSTFFAIVDGKIVGVIDIRHSLNDFLLKVGGHIGYSVHPAHRRKGYATQMLGLALEKCRELGIKNALVTCDKNNTGSRRTIEKNGGVLENEHVQENGNIVLRHWIAIEGASK